MKIKKYIIRKADVASIRDEYLKGKTVEEVTQSYNASTATIYAVIRGKHPLAIGLPSISRGMRVPHKKRKRIIVENVHVQVYTNLYGRYSQIG